MERYTVAVALQRTGGNPLLLIPFPPTATVSAFANEIKHRIARHNVDNRDEILLRLRREDGPILDGNDILANVISNPQTENIVVTSRKSDPENYLVSSKLTPSMIHDELTFSRKSHSKILTCGIRLMTGDSGSASSLPL